MSKRIITEIEREKRKECSRRWYLANKEKAMENHAEWVKKNPASARAIERRWREKNPGRWKKYYVPHPLLKAPPVTQEEKRARARRYYHEKLKNNPVYLAKSREMRIRDREKIRARCREWQGRDRKENPQKYREREKNKNARNPEYRRAKRMRNKAARRGAVGRFNHAHLKAVFYLQGGLCYYCGNPLGEHPHIEHMTPISRGGSNWPQNIVYSCPPCNMDKGAETAGEFVLRRGFPRQPFRDELDRYMGGLKPE